MEIKGLRTDRAWQQWGEVDPMYGVATIPGRSRSGRNPWNAGEFYAVGCADWLQFRESWDRYGRHHGECLEIGCGAGRMTKSLCKDFKHVTAIDVSPGMIATAKGNIDTDSGDFLGTAGTAVPLDASTVNAAFSTHVFQHLPDRDAGAAYLKEIWRVLAPGSTLMIHAPLISWPRGAFHTLPLGLHRVGSALGRIVVALKSYAYAD